MGKIVIGTSGGKNAGFDIPQLLVSRLLVQANSGGGKSFLLRRILEQAYGKIQAIVIDPAGEFATLREQFGYVLVGEHGETPVDIRSAGLVAEKLLELRASAVCDLYSLKPPAQRHIWVKTFLAAMMNAPKKLWHPVLVVVDEAHKFMPEKGEGDSEAKTEMLSLCSDGRKYGYCAILATQRLAKLDKSGASELLNVMIGPTFIDVDLERAHKALGIVHKEWAAFDSQMKTIRPGNFWALGRAISKKRVLVKVGQVVTSHPQAGSGKYSAEPPPAPDKVKALLPKLADLPKAAEEKARTEMEFKREIRELRQKLTQVQKAQPQLAVSPKVVFERDEKREQRIAEQAAKAARAPLLKRLHELKRAAKPVLHAIAALQGLADADLPAEEVTAIAPVSPSRALPVSRPVPPRISASKPAAARAENNGDGDLPPGERATLIAVAQHGSLERSRITILTGYKKSTRNAYIYRLATRGYLEEGAEGLQLTQAGLDALGDSYEPLPTGKELLDWWHGHLPSGERQIFQLLLDNQDSPVRGEQIDEVTGFKKSTRNAYLKRMKARGIVEEVGRGQVQLSANLLESGNGAAA